MFTSHSMDRQRLSGSLPIQAAWSPQGTSTPFAKPVVGHGVNDLSFSMKAELERSIAKHMEKSKSVVTTHTRSVREGNVFSLSVHRGVPESWTGQVSPLPPTGPGTGQVHPYPTWDWTGGPPPPTGPGTELGTGQVPPPPPDFGSGQAPLTWHRNEGPPTGPGTGQGDSPPPPKKNWKWHQKWTRRLGGCGQYASCGHAGGLSCYLGC